MIQTINANCLDTMKVMAANSQDLIFCDPPYALGSDVIIRKDGKPDYRKAVDFMSKWQQPDGYFWEQWFNEAFRVLRYGGRVVMFGMDRQLMLNKYYACFAGFAEQQSLYWFFISSFPKASDLGKMLDKNAGAEREVLCKNSGAKNNAINSTASSFVRGSVGYKEDFDLTTPATPLAQKYDGMKYSIAPLKQTNETILVFQKPYKTGSCLHDTLAYENGDAECMCGAVDVERNRCEILDTDTDKRIGTDATSNRHTDEFGMFGINSDGIRMYKENGRYPAQTYCDDEAAKVLDGQSGICKSGGGVKLTGTGRGKSNFHKNTIQGKEWTPDTGGCSRILHKCNYDINDYDIYHYCPKVSNKERNEGCGHLDKKIKDGHNLLASSFREDLRSKNGGYENKPAMPQSNNHPTVKPIQLLKKIIQLFKTPNDLHVLDPFMGSGSMGIACIELGVSYTGIELDPEYYTIAQTRLSHHENKKHSKLF